MGERIVSIGKLLGTWSLILSVSAALFGAGYNYRSVAGLEPRVLKLEEAGSPVVQKEIAVLKSEVEALKEGRRENRQDHEKILGVLSDVQKELARLRK